jgi:hypothetical protein
MGDDFFGVLVSRLAWHSLIAQDRPALAEGRSSDVQVVGMTSKVNTYLAVLCRHCWVAPTLSDAWIDAKRKDIMALT